MIAGEYKLTLPEDRTHPQVIINDQLWRVLPDAQGVYRGDRHRCMVYVELDYTAEALTEADTTADEVKANARAEQELQQIPSW